jgi:formylglycine-generating enzyme
VKRLKYILCLNLLLSIGVGAQSPTHTNSIGIQFVLIQPGKFAVGKFHPPYPIPSDTMKNKTRDLVMWMGDGRSYNQKEFDNARGLARKDSSDGFEVQISKPYYIGKFEVTQAQWKKIMGNNPSTFNTDLVADADDHPVENVTWDEAQEFISRLNKLEKHKRYRLPTEFEWEYAARAGAQDDIPWKEIQQTAQLALKTTQPVGKKQPNAWGLYDMLGNVWEWVADVYNEKIFADPVSPRRGNQHVLKGASFVGDVKNATYMTHAGGPGNGWDVGFRIIMTVDQK